MWACGACSVENPDDVASCVACGGRNPNSDPLVRTVSAFVLAWTLATVVAEASSMWAISSFIYHLEGHFGAVNIPMLWGLSLFALCGIFYGVVLGGAQMAVLRWTLRGKPWLLGWLSACIVGHCTGWCFLAVVHEKRGLLYAFTGACVGLLQLLVLKDRLLRRDRWRWVAASVLGVYMGASVRPLVENIAIWIYPSGRFDYVHWQLTSFFGSLYAGLLRGLITGCAMAWLIRRRASEARE